MSDFPRKADGRQIFTTEFKRGVPGRYQWLNADLSLPTRVLTRRRGFQNESCARPISLVTARITPRPSRADPAR